MFRRTEVLLKILPRPSYGSDPTATIETFKRLILEAVATDRVVHPNVVRVIDAGVGPDFSSFLALELLKGCDLADEIADKHTIGIRDALEIAIAVARGLCAAHARGVIHGDVKPSNIFLLEDGGVKLVDFSRAFVPETDDLREPGQARGTPGYMCPRYATMGVLDERCDIYSLGVTLHEALSGASVFASPGRFRISEQSLLLRIDEPRPPTLLHELVAGVSGSPRAECTRCESVDRAAPESAHRRNAKRRAASREEWQRPNGLP